MEKSGLLEEAKLLQYPKEHSSLRILGKKMPKLRFHAMSDEERKLQNEKIVLMKLIDTKFDAIIEVLQDIKKCVCFDYVRRTGGSSTSQRASLFADERNMCEPKE